MQTESIYDYIEATTDAHPAYLSIKKAPDGVVIRVRSASEEAASEINLSMDDCSEMVSALTGDTPIELIALQLKNLAAVARSFVGILNYSEFEFELGQSVRIPMSGEEGYIRARAEYQHKEPDYLVYYKAVDSKAANEWFSESLIEAVLTSCEDDLPTDAEIPLEQPSEAAQ